MSSEFNPLSAEVDRVFSTFATTPTKQRMWCADAWSIILALRQHVSLDQSEHDTIFACAAVDFTMTKTGFTARWLPQVAAALHMTAPDVLALISQDSPQQGRNPKRQHDHRDDRSRHFDPTLRCGAIASPLSGRVPRSLVRVTFFAAVKTTHGASSVVLSSKSARAERMVRVRPLHVPQIHDSGCEWQLCSCELHVDPNDGFAVTNQLMGRNPHRSWHPITAPVSIVVEESATPAEFYFATAGYLNYAVSSMCTLQRIDHLLSHCCNSLSRARRIPKDPREYNDSGQRLWAVTNPNFDWAETFIVHAMCTCFAVEMFQPRFEPDATLLPNLAQHGDPCAALEHFFQVLGATDVVDNVARMISFNMQGEQPTLNALRWGVFLLAVSRDWAEAKVELLPLVMHTWPDLLPFLSSCMEPDRLQDLRMLRSWWRNVRTSFIFRSLWRRSHTLESGTDFDWAGVTAAITADQVAVVEAQWSTVAAELCSKTTLSVSALADLFPRTRRRKSPTLTNSEAACNEARCDMMRVEQMYAREIQAEVECAIQSVSVDFAPNTGVILLALRAKSMQTEFFTLWEVARKLGAPFPAGHPITALAALLQNDAPIGDVASAFDAALQAEGGLIGKLPVGFLSAVDVAIHNGVPQLCQDFPSHAAVRMVVAFRRPSCPVDLCSALDDFLEAHSALSQGSPVISSGFESWKKCKFPSIGDLCDYLMAINWSGEHLVNVDPQAIECALDGGTTAQEEALLQSLSEACNALHGPHGWAELRDDPAAEAEQLIRQLADARGALATLVATQVTTLTDVATCRAECCTAATNLAQFLPPLESSPTEDAAQPTPCCVSGIDACSPRPPPALVQALVDAVAGAKAAHADAVAAIVRAASSPEQPIAAVARATAIANAVCGTHVDNLKAAMLAADAALTGAVALSAEECGHHRAIAESVLEKEGPWAGDVGLQRRDAAITSLDVLTARRKATRQAVKRAERTTARAELELHSDVDDDEAIEAATTALQTAKAQLSAALPELHTATAAVQHWATTGEGALALQAFPGDAVLTSALSGLFEADFSAETALPRTPEVDMAMEYPAGLTEASAVCVYFAQRAASDPDATDTPVVLRRLRLSSPEHVDEAKRQLRDAGRIAIGLQACPDAAAGCPPVVKATRWFVAKGPGGGVADAWLEFPRARFGTLAEALGRGSGVFSAAAAFGLCQRLVRAVAQLHAAGIRHGDLNPSNIVLWDDPRYTVVRPGVIDLLDTVSVGATRTLRGATMEWLPPEAVAAMTGGDKVLGTQQLDLWQLGRICQAVLSASADSAQLGSTVCEAVSTLCVADPAARRSAAEVLFDIEHAVAGAASSTTWALPPGNWLCQRGAAPGVDFVSLDLTTDPAAVALAACATSVGRRVQAVYRLENVQLWHVYAAERARVGEQAQGAPLPPQLQTEVSLSFAAAPDGARQALVGSQSHTEVLLFHGAPRNTHRLIAEGGLDPSYSGERVGSLFGAATCLTPLWAKAANEYAPGGGAGVFVTRVAVGRVANCLTTPTAVTSRYRRPPDLHHSVVGSNGRPGVVVAVYRPSRMYPEYFVVFDD